MPLYDYQCVDCGAESEKSAPVAERHNQKCGCGGRLDIVFKPQPRYVPFQPYFDLGLGVEITGRDHHRRVMRDLQCDHRDPPRPGDRSARRDRMEQAKREQQRREA